MDDPGIKVEQVDNRVGQGGSQVIQSLQIDEENRNIEDNILNAEMIATDSNENVSPGDRTSCEVKEEEPQIRVGDNVLEQIPSTESESSGCSQVIQETLTDIVDHDSKTAVPTSNVLEDSEKTDVPNNAVLGNSLGEPDKADKSGGGRTTPDSPSSIYQVKWVVWGRVQCPVITQNENGPCPLISIVNVLLLRGKLSLPEGCQVISAGQLLEWLADLLLDLREGDQASRPDFQHNINDAIAVLPKLQTGLDVNVRFTGVADFEYTEDSLIFDLLDISLYHGWLVDPQTTEVAAAVANMSYNQLVENIISNRSSNDSHAMSRALVAEQWLEDSRSQLTYHGLAELSTTLKEGELAVFFRNNHFSTVHRSGGQLFLLVTDQGFLEKSSLVWETLANIEGDTEFVDAQFRPGEEGMPQGEEGDRALALALGRQEEQGREREQEWEQYKGQLGVSEELSDAQLAARLQEAENQAAAVEARQGEVQGQQGPSNPIGPRAGGRKDKNCCIL